MSTTHVHEALSLLADAAAGCAQELKAYPSSPQLDSSDEEKKSQSPILDKVSDASGSAIIFRMTKFSAKELHRVWITLSDIVKSSQNVGQGRKSQISQFEVFFMTFTVLKNGGNWNFLEQFFKMEGSTFERLIKSFKKLKFLFFEEFVERAEETRGI